MEELFTQLTLKNIDEFIPHLKKFVNDYVNISKFDFLDQDNLRGEIWENIFSHLEYTQEPTTQENCLIALRILSRDKTNIDKIITKDKLNIVLECAGLNRKQDHYTTTAVTNEAQKLFCNLLFNSIQVQSLITEETSSLEILLDRLKKYDSTVKPDTILFDVRILFLMTALIEQSRSFVNDKYQGNILLIVMLKDISKKYTCNKNIEDTDAVLASEILKTLFNLFIDIKDYFEEDLKIYDDLVYSLRKLLLCTNEKHRDNLQNNIVNLLTVLPSICYSKIITVISDKDPNDTIIYENVDMGEIHEIINFLNNKFNGKIDLTENLSPVLTALIKMCKAERLIRKYVRMQVLPPLKDVLNRPEEGTTLRNKLCKLLTTPITKLRDLSSEFLFILCKEKVGRMIKYTGYGNAAGMFANKGLLGSGPNAANYSSESEDSDTEEYEQYKNQINPVVGCYESPHPNPLEGMTEEQKEYEALKLVNLVDELQRGGIIQPCRIGDDGKPTPIEHVLELQNQLSKQKINDSD